MNDLFSEFFSPLSYECKCDDPGFTPNADKTECLDINECDTNNGGCGQKKCENNYGSYSCRCPPGHQLDTMYVEYSPLTLYVQKKLSC